MIIVYIITFIVIGFIIGVSLEKDTGIGIIIIISMLWAFIMGPWAIATLIELTLGFTLAKALKF